MNNNPYLEMDRQEEYLKSKKKMSCGTLFPNIKMYI